MNFLKYLTDTARSSYRLFKNGNAKVTGITILDFVMQIYPGIWYPYLTYTAIRCSILVAIRLRAPTIKDRKKIWQEAQLYSSTKVLGLIISQAMLTFLRLTTPLSVVIVLCWGIVLASISAFAYSRAAYKPNKTAL
jgi:hypothetical protein